MTNIFLVAGGGALGSAGRYLVGRLAGQIVPGAHWPWGTLAVNITGGFAVGLLAGWLTRLSAEAGEPWRLFIGVGLLGGFTTFSAFSLETFAMIERGQAALALVYALLSVAGAILALALGVAVMRGVA